MHGWTSDQPWQVRNELGKVGITTSPTIKFTDFQVCCDLFVNSYYRLFARIVVIVAELLQ